MKITVRSRRAKLALGLYCVSGAIALGYEVIWSQVIVQWTSTRTFAFAVTLATYLTGWALGSSLCARRAPSIANPWSALGAFISLAGVVSLGAAMTLGSWLHTTQVTAATLAFSLTGNESVAMTMRFAIATVWVVLLPTTLLGAAFPIALRIIASVDHVGADTGAVIAWNTLGGIAGTLITGFLLVPTLGIERSLALMALMACAVGVVAMMNGEGVNRLARFTTWTCAAVTAASVLVVRSDYIATQVARAKHGELVFFQSDAGGTVAVIEQARPQNFRRLYIDGVSNSGDSMTSQRYMRLQGLLPLLIHRGEPHAALVIGLGTGITAGSLLNYPLEKRVVAELLPGTVAAAALFEGNQAVARDPRVDIRLHDGRRELLLSNDTYDLITLEPPPPSASGIVNLYSTDFYRLASRRLNADGLLAQWLPLPTQIDADTRSLVRSFLDAFPYVSLWTTELHEMLLIGSHQPIELDVARIATRFERPSVITALQEIGIPSPMALMSTWVTDRAGLERYAAAARPVTDDDPRIEYGPWVLPNEILEVLPRLLQLQTEPPLMNADAAFLREMHADRDRLNRFYLAGLYAYSGDRDHWSEALDSVLAEDPRNTYYRWVSGLE